ncbi:MAG TPA: preprotein translocase subunit YajC [Flavobacterium sp.]|nr:preprotein translocase subunit YajC [Flavobacterium sp.]
MEGMMAFLPYLLIFAVFYFLIIMPQQKRAKKEKTFESDLKVGDKIITKSGIHGRIAELSADSLVIETMSGKLKMERSSVSMELSMKANAQK